MARVTIEDCLEEVDNRFNLVMLATKRARHLANGADSELASEGDKVTVWALREIANGKVKMDYLDKDVEEEDDHHHHYTKTHGAIFTPNND